MKSNRGGRVLALAISAMIVTGCGKSSEQSQPTAEDIAKAVVEEMQASAEKQGVGWKSVDAIAGTPEGTKAASALDIKYPIPFYRVFVDEQGNVFLEDLLIPSPAVLTQRTKTMPSKEWRVVAHHNAQFDAIYPLLEALTAAGVTAVTFTAPSDAYQPPRIELGLECEKENRPRETREICMDRELQAKLYRERQCCLIEDPNPRERASPPVTLAGQSFSDAGMPVWEVDFDGTILHAGATMAGTANIVAALRDSRGKSVVLRPNKRASFKDVAPLFTAAKDVGVERIYIIGGPPVSGNLQEPDIEERAAKLTEQTSNPPFAVENERNQSISEDYPQSPASHGSSVASTKEASDSNPGAPRDDKETSNITPPSTQGRGARITQPEYPPASRRAGEAGVVTLGVYVLETGRVGEVKVEKSSGFDRLDESAVREVQRNWKLVPGMQDGVPTPMWHTFSLTFRVDN